VNETPAHTQKFIHTYLVHYPDHEPRDEDPHYKDFEAYRQRTKATAVCDFGRRCGDFSMCEGEMELHHAHIEFAVQNAIDLTLLERDYPGVSNPDEVGAWTESAPNLLWLCEAHHRGAGGVHNASSSDYEAEHYVRNLVSES
jgi:hypothetical protein